jgi:hypothetical protein
MKPIYVDGKSTGFVVATDLAAIAAELPPEPANVIPSNCVARTSLCDGIQQHLLRSFFRLRMTCNSAWGWLVRLVDLTLTTTIGIPGSDGFISFFWWQRTNVIVAMSALEITAP